ncbi:hypothetical protein [Oligella urethralis]|uniref:hypothetical protein n=1 Tax=Oligella urethralis TaxID=90245 RepID=UPI00242F9777|nr:hypothetical protein [Oligella urethralis]
MKKLTFITTLIFMVLFSLSACEKENHGNDLSTVSKEEIKSALRELEEEKDEEEEEKWLRNFCKNWGDLEAAKEKCKDFKLKTPQ